MSRRQKVLLSIFSLHLVLVGLGAAQVDLSRFGAFGRALNSYGQMSGSSSGYGFFAPGVGDGLRAEFDIKEGKEIKMVRLEKGVNRESDLRIGNLLNALSKNLEDEKARRSVSASLSAKMFAQHPKATEVTCRLEIMTLPTMEEYRAGEKVSPWKPLYRARYVRQAKKT